MSKNILKMTSEQRIELFARQPTDVMDTLIADIQQAKIVKLNNIGTMVDRIEASGISVEEILVHMNRKPPTQGRASSALRTAAMDWMILVLSQKPDTKLTYFQEEWGKKFPTETKPNYNTIWNWYKQAQSKASIPMA